MRKSFLVALCLVLLAGCGSGNQGSSSSENTENKPTEEPAVETASEITLDELKSYLTYHEVTADNWETIFSHGIQKDYEMDAFGDKTNDYYIDVMLHLNEEYALTQNYVMRLHLKASGLEYGYPMSWDTNVDRRAAAFMPLKNDNSPEAIVMLLHTKRGITQTMPVYGNDKLEGSVDDEYTLEFIKAIGSAVTIDIPEEIWTLDEKTGKRFFMIIYNEDEEEIKRKLYEDGSWVLLKNGTVFDRFNPKNEYYEWPDDLPVNYLVNAGWKLFDLIGNQ